MNNNNKTSCCGNIDLSKLGSCKNCIILSIILNIICWSGYILENKYLHLYWLSLTIFILSCLFALLFLAHIVAFFSRKNK
jgi:hypothetical protein